MNDWKETRGDEWGFLYWSGPDDCYATIVETSKGEFQLDSEDAPLTVIRALLHAHELRRDSAKEEALEEAELARREEKSHRG